MSSHNIGESESLMTIQDMIDVAFDGHDRNTVNFKLLRTIFYILAKQMRVLDRRVEVSLSRYGSVGKAGSTSLVVEEVKLVAEIEKKVRSAAGLKYQPPSDIVTGKKSEISTYASARSMVKQRTIDDDSQSTSKSDDDISAAVAKEKSPITRADLTVGSVITGSTIPATPMTGAPIRGASETDASKSGVSVTGTTVTGSSTTKRHNIMGVDSSSSSEPKTAKGINQVPAGRKSTEGGTIIPPRSMSREDAAMPLPDDPSSLPVKKEVRKEKLLVVGQAGPEGKRLSSVGEQIAVVTKAQFIELQKQVAELEERFLPVGKAALPENIELLKELRRGASLTTAMAALQLSIRLEGTENMLTKMTEVISGLAKRTGLNVSKDNNLEILYENLSKTKEINMKPVKKSAKVEKDDSPRPSKGSSKILQKRKSVVTDSSKPITDTVTFTELQEILKEFAEGVEKTVANLISKNKATTENAIKMAGQIESKLTGFTAMGKKMEDLEMIVSDYADKVTVLDTSLSSQMTNYQEQLTQMQHDLEAGIENMAEAVANAGGDTTVKKLAGAMAGRKYLTSTLLPRLSTVALPDDREECGPRRSRGTHYGVRQRSVMAKTCTVLFSNNARKLRLFKIKDEPLIFKARLISRLTDQAVAELNNHFSSLQIDVDQLITHQKEFEEVEELLACDIKDLWRQVEFLKAAKSDREEVEDALRDKAGIDALNGLVTLDQFEAVRGDFDKRIAGSYSLFNNQELIWQKLIDDVLRDLNEKADFIQVVSLQDSIRRHCEHLQKRIDFMLEVVGEPTAAAITRKIHRNANCISCATPAHMNLEETSIPALPAIRPPTIGAETQDKPKDSGDYTLLCYPGRKTQHPIDPRAKFCRRYCGGSHTVLPNAEKLARAPQAITINPLSGEQATVVGTDGKVYRVDPSAVPCKPCNFVKGSAAILTATLSAAEPQEQAKIPNNTNGDMTPSDYRQEMSFMRPAGESVALTPPMLLE